jgi:hypothetical protein
MVVPLIPPSSSPRPPAPGPSGTPYSPGGMPGASGIAPGTTGRAGVFGSRYDPSTVTKKWGLFARGAPGTWRPPTITTPPPPGSPPQQPTPVPQPPPKDPGAEHPPIPPFLPPFGEPADHPGAPRPPTTTTPQPPATTTTPMPPQDATTGGGSISIYDPTRPPPIPPQNFGELGKQASAPSTSIATGSQLAQPISSPLTKGGTFTAQASTAPQQLQQQTFTAQAAPPPQMQAPTTTTQSPAFPVQASIIDGSNPLDVNGDGAFNMGDVNAGLTDMLDNGEQAIRDGAAGAANAAGDIVGGGGAMAAETIADILRQWNEGWDAGMGGPPPGMMDGLNEILGSFGFDHGSLVDDVGMNWTTAMDPAAWEQRANNLMATASEQGWADLNRQERRLNDAASRSGMANSSGIRSSMYNNLSSNLQNQQRNIWNDSLLQQMQALQGAGSFANQQQAMDQSRWSQMLGMLGQANQADTQYAQDNYLGFGEALGGALGVGASVLGQGANGVGQGAGGMSELIGLIGKLGMGGFGI